MTDEMRTGRIGRRQFVKGAGVIAATSALSPALLYMPTRVSAQSATPAATPSVPTSAVINVPDVKKYAGATIHLAVQKHTATDAIQEMASDFESQTGVTVNFEQIPQQQLDQKQRTDLATGTGSYDVIGWFLNPEYVENKWIRSVDEMRVDASVTDEALLAFNDFYQPFVNYYTYKNTLYGLPFYGESIMMYYNTEEFAKAGITKAPETVDELEAACKAIKAGGRMAGIALRASQDGNAAIYPFLGWLYGYGGYWVNYDTMEIGLDKPEAIEAAEAWGHFLRDYGPADVASYFWNEVQLSMQQEKAAIIMDATNFAPRLEDPAESKIPGKVGYAVLPSAVGPNGPRGPQQTKGRFGNPATAYALSVPTTAKNWQAAWMFVQWATSPAIMLATTQLGLRADPTRQSSYASPDFVQKYNFGNGSWDKVVNEDFATAMENYWPHNVLTQADLADVLGLALSQIVTGQKSAKDAMTEAQSKSTDIQKQAGLIS